MTFVIVLSWFLFSKLFLTFLAIKLMILNKINKPISPITIFTPEVKHHVKILLIITSNCVCSVTTSFDSARNNKLFKKSRI